MKEKKILRTDGSKFPKYSATERNSKTLKKIEVERILPFISSLV
jgi:hypothetical protein